MGVVKIYRERFLKDFLKAYLKTFESQRTLKNFLKSFWIPLRKTKGLVKLRKLRHGRLRDPWETKGFEEIECSSRTSESKRLNEKSEALKDVLERDDYKT